MKLNPRNIGSGPLPAGERLIAAFEELKDEINAAEEEILAIKAQQQKEIAEAQRLKNTARRAPSARAVAKAKSSKAPTQA